MTKNDDPARPPWKVLEKRKHGLVVRGRGAWHQADTMGEIPYALRRPRTHYHLLGELGATHRHRPTQDLQRLLDEIGKHRDQLARPLSAGLVPGRSDVDRVTPGRCHSAIRFCWDVSRGLTWG